MTDHDPLAEALCPPGWKTDEKYDFGDFAGLTTTDDFASTIRRCLDAAGYEVRPKLTVERLAAALHGQQVGCGPTCYEARRYPDRSPGMVASSERIIATYHGMDAAAILQALEADDG